jgi:tetratricopeptide (TPR) repeat protein
VIGAAFVVAFLATAVAPELDAARAEAAAAEAVGLHTDGKLDEASEALARAHAIYPDRDYLYMRGIIEREAGHCDVAVELFEAFLAESPPLVDVEATQAELDKCGATMPQPAPAPPPVVTAPPPLEPPTDRPPPRARPTHRPWWRDPAGGALLGSGLVLAATGGALLGGAAVRGNAADDAATAGDYRDAIATARGLEVAGFTLLGVATGLVVGGVVRWAIVARRKGDVAID